MANNIKFVVLGDIKDFEKNLKRVNSISKNVAATAGKAFLGLSASIGLTVAAAKDAEKVFNQTKAVIKSTGGVAGITANQAKNLAKSLQEITTFGDEAILSVENLLFTFKEISKDVFPRTTKAILDLSVAMNQGLKESAIQVGKALNDPVLGLTALRRVGIQFSKDQENQIKAFAETNQMLKAQKIILSELESQFGGSAEAARKGLGAIDALKNSLADLAEVVGTYLAPSIIKLTEATIDFVKFIESNEAIVSLAGTFIAIGTAVSGVILIVAALTAAITTIGGTVALAITALVTFISAATVGFFSLKEEAKETNEILSGEDGVFSVGSKGAKDLAENMDALQLHMKAIEDESFILGNALKTAFQAGFGTSDLGTISVVGSAGGSEGEDSQAPGFLSGFSSGLDEIKKKLSDMTTTGKTFAKALHAGFSDAISSMITGSKSAKEAFSDFGKTMLNVLANYVAEWLSFQLISKTALAASTTLGVASGAALAAAYAPAALAASIASFGGAAVAGAAANTLAAASFAASMNLVRAAASFAVGTPNIPQDMVANVHKGETIIPETFAEGIRSGEMTLSGGEEGGSNATFDFRGASFNGITEEFVKDIFTKASESIRNRTLSALPA